MREVDNIIRTVGQKRVLSNYPIPTELIGMLDWKHITIAKATKQHALVYRPNQQIPYPTTVESDREMMDLFSNCEHWFAVYPKGFVITRGLLARWAIYRTQKGVQLPHVIIGGRYIPDQTIQLLVDGLIQESDPKDGYVAPNGLSLRPYQSMLVNYLLDHMRAGLFVDMGLGKTLVTLQTIDELFKRKELDPKKIILVVGPLLVASNTWPREVEDWQFDFDVIVLAGSDRTKRRQRQYDSLRHIERPTLVTINREQLPNFLKYFQDDVIEDIVQMVVIDELSLYKGAETQGLANMKRISANVERFVGLTGTPAPNNLLDMWGQMSVIDSRIGDIFGHTQTQYISRFFQPINPDAPFQLRKYVVISDWYEYLLNVISQYAISLQSDGLVNLPEATFTPERLPLPKDAAKLYAQISSQMRQQLMEAEASGSRDGAEMTITYDIKEGGKVVTKEQTIQVANRGVLSMKLLQLASGALYDNMNEDDGGAFDDIGRAYRVYHDVKIERLKELVEAATSPVLIFYSLHSERHRIMKAIKCEELKQSAGTKAAGEVIKRWNAGKIPVMLMQPEGAGHGLNIQKGGHTIIWFGPPRKNETYRQANKRLIRSGQPHPTVSVVILLADGTEDVKQMKTLETNESNQQELLARTQVHIQKTEESHG